MLSNHLILCRPLLLVPSLFHSIRVFSSKSVLHIRWSKYWGFSFSISPSNEQSGLISFRIYLFDLLEVQGILKNILQHHCSKASILQCSAFFMVQLSHLYMTTGKTTGLTRWPFVGKVMSLLFSMVLGLSQLFFQGGFGSISALFQNNGGSSCYSITMYVMTACTKFIETSILLPFPPSNYKRFHGLVEMEPQPVSRVISFSLVQCFASGPCPLPDSIPSQQGLVHRQTWT